MKFFQKKRNEETYETKLLALIKQETDKLLENRKKLSDNLDLCIQGIRSIQRMSGIPEEELI